MRRRANLADKSPLGHLTGEFQQTFKNFLIRGSDQNRERRHLTPFVRRRVSLCGDFSKSRVERRVRGAGGMQDLIQSEFLVES
jgi:hypothetical protein